MQEMDTQLHLTQLNPTLFNQHLWLYCSFLKQKQKQKPCLHNRHSINISEWKNEEIFCKCHLHSSISKHGLKGEYSAQYSGNTSDLCAIVVFLPQAISALVHANGGLVMKISCPASLLCPVRNQSFDTGKQEYVSLCETCVASARKPKRYCDSLFFHQDSYEECTLCVVFGMFLPLLQSDWICWNCWVEQTSVLRLCVF